MPSQNDIKIIEALLKRREELKDELKKKHPQAYQWLIDHKIDLDNLQKYSRNIAAALLLTTQVATTNPQIIPVPTPTPPRQTATNQIVEETAEEKEAREVWEKYKEIILAVSQKYDIPPEVIFATIMTESRGNPQAFRYEPHIDDASYGLGQILSRTAYGLGFNGMPEELFKPEVSIDLIGRYYRRIKDKNEMATLNQMIAAYNTGSIHKTPKTAHMERFNNWYNIAAHKSFAKGAQGA